MGDFEVDTRVEPVGGVQGSGGVEGAGRFAAHLHEDWRIWGPNGGYLAAIALRAVGACARVPRPASMHCHFLSVARFAPVELEVTPIRVGRRAESFRVAMSQEGRTVLEGMVRTAAVVPGLEHDVTRAPRVPAPHGLADSETLRARHAVQRRNPHAFWKNLERRPVSEERFVEGPRPRAPEWREWCRFRPRDTFDDPFVDAGRYLLLVDTLSWPAAVQPHEPEPGYTAPNLDVTAWFHRAAPHDPWLLVDHASPVAEAGLMGTHGRVWSSDGRLLATGGAQLFCVPVSP